MSNDMNKQCPPRELFIEELEQITGGILGRGRPVMTTMAIGEEDGGGITTMALGEESGGPIYTTLAVGEEDGGRLGFGFFQ